MPPNHLHDKCPIQPQKERSKFSVASLAPKSNFAYLLRELTASQVASRAIYVAGNAIGGASGRTKAVS
jgi:hypothetical protein